MDEYFYGNENGFEKLEDIFTRKRLAGVRVDIEPIAMNEVQRFAAESEVSYFNGCIEKDFNDSTRFRFAVSFARLPLDQFIEVQCEQLNVRGEAEYFDAHFFPDHIENELRDPYERGELPVPYFEFERDSSLKDHQEGRHRAWLEQDAGADTIDVMLAVQLRK